MIIETKFNPGDRVAMEIFTTTTERVPSFPDWEERQISKSAVIHGTVVRLRIGRQLESWQPSMCNWDSKTMYACTWEDLPKWADPLKFGSRCFFIEEKLERAVMK